MFFDLCEGEADTSPDEFRLGAVDFGSQPSDGAEHGFIDSEVYGLIVFHGIVSMLGAFMAGHESPIAFVLQGCYLIKV